MFCSRVLRPNRLQVRPNIHRKWCSNVSTFPLALTIIIPSNKPFCNGCNLKLCNDRKWYMIGQTREEFIEEYIKSDGGKLINNFSDLNKWKDYRCDKLTKNSTLPDFITTEARQPIQMILQNKGSICLRGNMMPENE